MTQVPLLEQAHQGNPQAISHLINRSLQKQEITATVESNNGFLEVMLEASQVPNEKLAAFIRQGLLKLKIETAYEAGVYGRKAGEHFATWSQQFELKPRPTTDFVAHHTSTLPQFDQSNESAMSQPRPLAITLATEDGGTVRLDLALILGILGTVLIVLGAFAPVFSVPILGNVSFFRDGSEEGYILIGCAIASMIFLLKKQYTFLWSSALGASGIVALVFIVFQMRLHQVKSSLDSDLADNPFRGLADAAVASVQMQWGWIVLIFGCAMLLFAAFLRQRKPGKQTYRTLAVAIALLVVMHIVVDIALPSIQYAGQAAKAKESEAKQDIGSMNRSQQAYYLEKNAFSWQIEDLGIGMRTETTNYHYQITIADKERAVALGTAKTDGLKSYAGGVFAIHNSSPEVTTVAIECQSDQATQTPVEPPTLNGTEPECASGSSKLN